MSKELLARGQATLTTQQDAYTISQSVGEYVFPAAYDAKITAAASVVTEIKVTRDNKAVTSFTIGIITKPAGFSTVTVDNANKRVTFTVAANTTTLADHGKADIPIVIAGATYHLAFVWSKVKAGTPGAAGTDANLLDWVKEWNTGKTQIDESTVITPKLFAGVKNADSTLTGTAVGRFAVSTKTASGSISTETVDGICGFKDGYKTFSLDNGGNAQLGRGDQFIKYNAVTGKVEFGAGVSLLWAGATYIDRNGIFTGTLSSDTVKAMQLTASQITSGTIAADRIDTAALKSTLITAGNYLFFPKICHETEPPRYAADRTRNRLLRSLCQRRDGVCRAAGEVLPGDIRRKHSLQGQQGWSCTAHQAAGNGPHQGDDVLGAL